MPLITYSTVLNSIMALNLLGPLACLVVGMLITNQEISDSNLSSDLDVRSGSL